MLNPGMSDISQDSLQTQHILHSFEICYTGQSFFFFLPLYFTIATLCWPKLHNRGILDVLNLGVVNHRTCSSRSQSWQLLGWGKLPKALWCLWFQVCCCSGQYQGRHRVKDSQGSTKIFKKWSVMFTIPKDLYFWMKKLLKKLIFTSGWVPESMNGFWKFIFCKQGIFWMPTQHCAKHKKQHYVLVMGKTYL